MNIAIMQPYFLPYLGYWQLLSAVDKFVIYDNIQYTKKGWFNRNYILSQGEKKLFTLPLQKASDYLNVDQRSLADNHRLQAEKNLRLIQASYKNSAFFQETYGVIEQIFLYPDPNLFRYIANSIQQIKAHLAIQTELLVSSEIEIDHSLKSEQKVIALCRQLNAKSYINPPGGVHLYNSKNFAGHGIELFFIEPNCPVYKQPAAEFHSHLSIIDLLMCVGKDSARQMLANYSIFKATDSRFAGGEQCYATT